MTFNHKMMVQKYIAAGYKPEQIARMLSIDIEDVKDFLTIRQIDNTEKPEDKALRMWQEYRWTTGMIAKRLKTTETKVIRMLLEKKVYLRDYMLTINGRGRTIVEKLDIEEEHKSVGICKLYEKGMSIKEVAKVYTLSPGRIHSILVENGVKRRSHGGK